MIVGNKGEDMSKLKIGLLFCGLLMLGGCANAVNDGSYKNNPLLTTSEGVSYKKFNIEGCTYIGTQDEEKVWHFAGPSSCSKPVPAGMQYQ